MNLHSFHFAACIFITFVFWTQITASKFTESTHNAVVKDHQPKQLDLFKWLFDGVRKSHQNVTLPLNRTSSTPFLVNTSTSPTPAFTTTENKIPSSVITNIPSHPYSSSNLTTHNNSSLNFSTNEREGKQLLGGNAYFPYPIYTWPWNTLQTPFMQPPYHSQNHRHRPVYNVFAEEDGHNVFGVDDGDDYDTNSEFDEVLNELKEAHHLNQLDRISIEIQPYSSNEDTESTTSDEIEDYDINNNKAVDTIGDFKLLKLQNNKKIFPRSIEKSTNSQTYHCTGHECSAYIFDQRRPVSRGRPKTFASASSQDQFSSVVVLSPYLMDDDNTTSTSLVNTTTTPQSVDTILANNSSPAHITASSMTDMSTTSILVTTTIIPTSSTPSFGNGSNNDGNSTLPPSTDATSNTHPVATPSSMTSSNENFNSTIIDITPATVGVSGNATTENSKTTDLPTSTTESSIIVSVALSITPSSSPSMVSQTSTTITTNGTSTEGTTTAKPLPSISAILNCQCGVQSIFTENVGSTLVRVPGHPWIVEIFAKNKHQCAGSIISDNYILTSANCVDKFEKRNLRVVAGLQLKNSKSFSVSKVALHPKFDPLTLLNDLALLRLSERIKASREIRPVCLPLQTQTQSQAHKTAHLITWSHVGEQRRNLQLLQTEVELINSTSCQNMINTADNGDIFLSNGTFCASPPGQRKCSGDVGGILQVYAGKFSYEQIGVVTRTVGCRATKLPGIYTDVRHYLRWILFQTQDSHYCREPINGNFDT